MPANTARPTNASRAKDYLEACGLLYSANDLMELNVLLDTVAREAAESEREAHRYTVCCMCGRPVNTDQSTKYVQCSCGCHGERARAAGKVGG